MGYNHEMNEPLTPGKLLSLSRPYQLVQSALYYTLGLALNDYFGKPADWPAFFLGLGCVWSLQLTLVYLDFYFSRLRKQPGDMQNLQKLMFAAFTALIAGAAMTTFLYGQGNLSMELFVLLGAGLFLAVAFSVPPFNLARRGFGELIQACLVCVLAPAIGYLLQSGTFHSLLNLSTFPLVAFYVAGQIARNLPNMAEDIQQDNQNLITLLGWQRAMQLHNLCVLGGFLLLGLAIAGGLPWHVSWTVFLVLPVGLGQIWLMQQIGDGAKPNWKMLSLLAEALILLPVYLLAFGYFIG